MANIIDKIIKGPHHKYLELERKFLSLAPVEKAKVIDFTINGIFVFRHEETKFACAPRIQHTRLKCMGKNHLNMLAPTVDTAYFNRFKNESLAIVNTEQI